MKQVGNCEFMSRADSISDLWIMLVCDAFIIIRNISIWEKESFSHPGEATNLHLEHSFQAVSRYRSPCQVSIRFELMAKGLGQSRDRAWLFGQIVWLNGERASLSVSFNQIAESLCTD